MRRSLSTLIASAILLVGSAADAGLLTSATWTQEIQGIDITLTLGGATCTDSAAALHVQQTIGCPGIAPFAGLSAEGLSFGSSYSVSLLLPSFSLSQVTTGGAINIFTNATRQPVYDLAISGSSAAAAATMGVPGMATVKVALHNAKGVNASQFVPGLTTLLKVPLSIGKGGVETGYFYILTVPHYMTVDFYGWTPGTLLFTGLTTKNVPLPTPTLVAMGTHNLTAAGRGFVSLVAPSKVSIDGALAQRRIVSLTRVTFAFPEPSALLLLGAGAVGLGLAHGGKRRA